MYQVGIRRKCERVEKQALILKPGPASIRNLQYKQVAGEKGHLTPPPHKPGLLSVLRGGVAWKKMQPVSTLWI